jgi:transposase-like protein
MAENPKRPNCGRSMALLTKGTNPTGQHSFECEQCHLVFLTEDHHAITGPIGR